MRCTVAPTKSSEVPSARWPKLKMPDSVSKPGICGKLQQLATPNLQNLGLWEVGSLKLCDAPVTKQTPRFRCPASLALEFPLWGFQFAHQKLNQKKQTQAKHRGTLGTFHPSCFQVQVSSVSFHLLHWFVTFLGFEVEGIGPIGPILGPPALALFIFTFITFITFIPSGLQPRGCITVVQGLIFRDLDAPCGKACTSKLDTHSTHYWKILDI